MSEVEGLHYEKEKWGPGPWQTEPDRIEWEAHGFPCMAVRNTMGGWCGYVGVPEGHPAFEKGYSDVDVDVHGGLTYANHCQGHICHVPKPGQPDNVWWLGFDCGHCFDLTPAMNQYRSMENIEFREKFKDMIPSYMHEVYRDAAYIQKETTSLAQQLEAMK